MSKAEVALDARDTILTGVPERCQPCARPRIIARDLGKKVADGTVILEEATRNLTEDIERNCLLGRGVIGGCAGNEVVCGYGGRGLTDTEREEIALAAGGELSVDLLSTDELLLSAICDTNRLPPSAQT